MDLLEFKHKHIRESLGIKNDFDVIHTFVDFANVNHWFDEDQYDADGTMLSQGKRLIIDIEKLKEFAASFSADIRFYYGLDNENAGSFRFIRKVRDIFGKRRVFTKPIQRVRHYLTEE